MPPIPRKSVVPPMIGIAGWKKSGKTTLTVRLIEEFTNRGLKVASVKHAHHGFQVDSENTDSARHRRAGASEVAIVSGNRWAIVHELHNEPEPDFEEIISWLGPADLIIVEGYKTAPIPKVEARREASLTKRPLADDDPLVIAIAADHKIDDARVPVFDLDDIAAIADHIVQTLRSSQTKDDAAGAAERAPEISTLDKDGRDA